MLNILGDDNLCGRCTGLCCKYITVEIDKPTNKRERCDVRWYLLHEGITLLVEEDRWLLKVPTSCVHVDKNGHCSIYEDRPQTCKDYSTDNCDYHSECDDWENNYIELETAEDYMNYLDEQKKKRKAKAAARKRAADKKTAEKKTTVKKKSDKTASKKKNSKTKSKKSTDKKSIKKSKIKEKKILKKSVKKK